jgi:hypothetical protein
MDRRTLRRAGAALTLGAAGLACALVITACGSSSASVAGTTSTSTSTTGTTSSSLTAYRQCLQQHGFTAPQRPAGTTGPPAGGFGGGGGGGGAGAAGQQAFQACASLRPAGGGFGGRGGGGGGPGAGGSNQNFAKFEQCLQQHGVSTTSNRSSAKTQAAIAACRSVLSSAPAGAGA